MFDHVGFGVSNCAAGQAFFLQALEPLGVGIVMEGAHGRGNRQQVQAFQRASLAAGGEDNGAPGRHHHDAPKAIARLSKALGAEQRLVVPGGGGAVNAAILIRIEGKPYGGRGCDAWACATQAGR